jgi:signal recognition particle subunit SRP19
MKRPGLLTIWPIHLDSSRTREEGRRLPISRAVKQPTLKEVSTAAMSLGYSPQTTEKAALPSSHWEKTGFVWVKKAGPRPVVLKTVAGEIVKTRQKQAQLAEPKKR